MKNYSHRCALLKLSISGVSSPGVGKAEKLQQVSLLKGEF
jgi:hypothetical protein